MRKTPNDISICFVANFYKTFLFEQIANTLLAKGYNIFWIVPKKSQQDYLSLNYSSKYILGIDRTRIKDNYEATADFKLNELVFGDRVLRNEKKDGVIFLRNIQLPIYHFIKSNNISYVFGEVTWAHELLIHRMLRFHRELDCRYFSMMSTRIPSDRFVFFTDEKQSSIVEFNLNEGKNFKKIEVVQPAYLSRNNRILKHKMSFAGKLGRLKRFFSGENIEKTDPNVNVKGVYRWLNPLKEELNRISYRFLKKENNIAEITKRPYILFGFHKQPEASIDVSGRYFEDQFSNVVNLWRQLPVGWNIVVKEHTNALGDRGYHFFKRLKKYPNIILVNDNINTYKLMKECKLVVTNTGTMALEAALKFIPSITLSKVYFNKHNFCRHCNWQTFESYESLTELINSIKDSMDNSEEYTEFIYSNSFKGQVGDIMSNPSVIEKDNIDNISYAIVKLISLNSF